MTYRTRFAPSPTGYLHVGGARTALYCWLQAKKLDGEFVLRIEDTDRERSTQEAVDAILESMEWLGLDYAEEPVFQTQRFSRYKRVTEELLEEGMAYCCYCTHKELEQMRDEQRQAGQKPKYNGRCRDREHAGTGPYVIRFRSPLDGETRFVDQVHGELAFNNNELDDLIIVRSDGTPTYNLTVVVDDADMEITHVIRGDDHINNTPKQINIFNSMGVAPPVYAHVPMILGEDGSRLSKRHGAVSVLQYRQEGFLPEALLNYLVRLGWSHGDKEIFTLDELQTLFDVENVNRSASIFDPAKLLWLNKQHIQNMSPSKLAVLLGDELSKRGTTVDDSLNLEAVAREFSTRASTLLELADGCAFLFNDISEYDAKAAKAHLRPVILEPLTELLARFGELADWTEEGVENTVQTIVEKFELKFPKLAQPIRVAVTGKASSPSIGTTLVLLGKDRTIERVTTALEFVAQRAKQ